MKCINHDVCHTQHPLIMDNTCIECLMLFGAFQNGPGKLERVVGKQECPICLETTNKCYHLPQCRHWLCADCFNRCYFQEEECIELDFPLDDPDGDLRLQFTSDVLALVWHPILFEWAKLNVAIESDWVRRNDENRETLRKCPLCRKRWPS